MRKTAAILAFLAASYPEPSSAQMCSVPDGCSVPAIAEGLAYIGNPLGGQALTLAREMFRPACNGHDLCYSHGAATFGLSRAACDDDFRNVMSHICSDIDILSVAADIATGGWSRVACHAAKEAFYQAVRAKGASHYVPADKGTCCLYPISSRARESVSERFCAAPQPKLAFGNFEGDDAQEVFHATGSSWRIASGPQWAWKTLAKSSYKLDRLAFGDFDGDGKTDVFTATGREWRFASSRNRWNWQRLASSGAEFDQLALGDFDGDSKADVFLATGKEWRVAASRRGWSWQRLATSGYKLDQLAFGDFDGDRKTDIFVATGREWRIASARSGWSWRRLATSGYTLESLAIADVDGDGKDDVFRADGSAWFISRGGTSDWEVVGASALGLGTVALADLNGDGKADVFWGNGHKWRVSYSATQGWQEIAANVEEVY